MLEVDFSQARVIYNDELRSGLAKLKPFRDWIAEEMLTLADIADESGSNADTDGADMLSAVEAAKLGHHWDDVDEVVRPMALTGKVPLASMGIDAPLALPLHQDALFLRLLLPAVRPSDEPAHRRAARARGHFDHPVPGQSRQLAGGQPQRLPAHSPGFPDPHGRAVQGNLLNRPHGFHARTFRAVYLRDAGEGALERALDELCREVERAVRDGVNIVAISDRAGSGEVSIPSLLAVGAVHNHLMRSGLRTFADLIVECGDALSAHDLAALVSYSASGIYPYAPTRTSRVWRTRATLWKRRPCALRSRGHRTLRPRGNSGRGVHHVQDGHLHHAKLPFRPDLRGRRPRT